MLSLYNWGMASDKLLENQKKTAERLAKQAELERHQQIVDALASIKKNDTIMTQALIGFLSGATSKTEVVNQLKEIKTPDVQKVVDAVEKLEKVVVDKTVDLSPVVDALKGVESQLQLIPKEAPELPEAPEVDFTATNEKLDAVLKAIQSLDLVVEAPKVDVKVPKAQVNVEKVDLTEIKQPLLELLGAFHAFQIPEPVVTDLTVVEELLSKANEILAKIEKKNFGGGGGGGGMVPFKDPVTGMSVQVPTTTGGGIPVQTPSGKDLATLDEQNNQSDILEEIQLAVEAIAFARGVAADLRVTVVGGTLPTVTTVTTVTTLTNQSQMGGYLANPQIPAISNQAAIQSNINNVVVS